MVIGIVTSYAAWFDFGGVLFQSPYRIGLVWLTTFRRCIGCSTKEQCAACIMAAMNTIASFFPHLYNFVNP